MKKLRKSLSEAELTLWVVILTLFALILLTGYLFWKKVSAFGP
ncbi:MAG: hypothetical protein ABSH48_07310 [Verrucomicrobiota bacterium]|jgi:hypothetical protein